MDNSQMKAGSAEIKKRAVADLLRERVGYEQRKTAYDAEENEKASAAMQDRVDQVNAQLRHFGAEASAPAKRAERRPAVSARAVSR